MTWSLGWGIFENLKCEASWSPWKIPSPSLGRFCEPWIGSHKLRFDLRMRLICRELAKGEVVFQSGHPDVIIGLPSVGPICKDAVFRTWHDTSKEIPHHQLFRNIFHSLVTREHHIDLRATNGGAWLQWILYYIDTTYNTFCYNSFSSYLTNIFFLTEDVHHVDIATRIKQLCRIHARGQNYKIDFSGRLGSGWVGSKIRDCHSVFWVEGFSAPCSWDVEWKKTYWNKIAACFLGRRVTVHQIFLVKGLGEGYPCIHSYSTDLLANCVDVVRKSLTWGAIKSDW